MSEMKHLTSEHWNVKTHRRPGPKPSLTPEEMRLRNRSNHLTKAYLAGPPTERTWAAFRAKHHNNDYPASCLNPDESWAEQLRPIQPMDFEHAEAVCSWLAAGHDEVWLKRNWDGWPGDRTWLSWRRHPTVKAMIHDAEEKVSRLRQETAEQTLSTTFEEVKSGTYSDKLAMAVMGGARFVAEHSQKFAAARSPQRYGQHLTVTSTVQGHVTHSRSEGTQRLVDAVLETLSSSSPKTIEGTAEAVPDPKDE